MFKTAPFRPVMKDRSKRENAHFEPRLPFRAFFGTWGVRKSKKEISPSEVRKRESNFTTLWPIHANRSEWKTIHQLGTFSLQDRLTFAPDLDNPVIQNLEILPRFPGREYPDLPGYDSSHRYLPNLQDLLPEHHCDLLRAADMGAYPLDPDK